MRKLIYFLIFTFAGLGIGITLLEHNRDFVNRAWLFVTGSVTLPTALIDDKGNLNYLDRYSVYQYCKEIGGLSMKTSKSGLTAKCSKYPQSI